MNSNERSRVAQPAHSTRHPAVVARLRKIVFTGNSPLRSDAGGVLRPDAQVWLPRRATSACFEGVFCIPVINVELAVSPPVATPVRMALTGCADNGMVFQRAFTFPAGADRRAVRDIEADRTSGGVFDLISSIAWTLTSEDLGVVLEEPGTTAQPVFLLPSVDAARRPHETTLALLCRALRGLPCGHPETLARLWAALEPLDVLCADGVSRLGPAADLYDSEDAALDALMRNRRSGPLAWTTLLKRCLALAGYRPAAAERRPDPAPAAAVENGAPAWPWTIDDYALKLKLLAANCHRAAKARSDGRPA